MALASATEAEELASVPSPVAAGDEWGLGDLLGELDGEAVDADKWDGEAGLASSSGCCGTLHGREGCASDVKGSTKP